MADAARGVGPAPRRRYGYWGVAALVAGLAALGAWGARTLTDSEASQFAAGPAQSPAKGAVPRVFTPEDLARADGADPGAPLYLAILGEVYDVTAGRKYYGPGEGYHCFVGRDASAAFATGQFAGDGLTSDVADLAPDALTAVVGWRDFYARHAAYPRVGVLAERYYDTNGQPTAAWHAMEHRRRDIAHQTHRRDDVLARYTTCNSRSVMAEPFFTVWCDAVPGEDGPRFVRELLLPPLLPNAKEERRCVCALESQFNDPNVRSYTDCGPTAVTTCQRPRPTP